MKLARWIKSAACILTDHEYSWSGDSSEPYCLRCNAAPYWPTRLTIGRLIDDHRRWRHDRQYRRNNPDDIPF